jgi:hypothetical protein
MQFTVAVVVAFIGLCNAFVTKPLGRRQGLAPLRENFYIDLPTLNDPAKVTPALLQGEANYKNFVGKYDPNALLLGGEQYALIKRVRELELLSKTVDSGLLQALQDKGVTLTQLERLLPIIDNAGLLPLALKNKDLLVGVLPLLVEPAPALLPLVTSVVSTSSGTYAGLGVALFLAGGFELFEGNGLGVLPILLGAPALVLSAVIGKISEPLPAVSQAAVAVQSGSVSISRPVASGGGSRPRAAARKAAPVAKKAAPGKATVETSVKTAAPAAAASQNGKRKTVRIN